MPSPTAFHRGFEINVGTNLSGYVLNDLSVDHIVISKYHHYEFPIRMMFVPSSSASSSKTLLSTLKRNVHDNRIIYSEYGSPYECTFGTPRLTNEDKADGTVTIVSRGEAQRIYSKPTQQQEMKGKHATDVKGYIPPEQIDNVKEQLSGKYRVLKSHFSTGICTVCHESIHAGILIAQPFPRAHEYHHTGHWAHATCILGPRPGVRGRSRTKTGSSSNVSVSSTIRTPSRSQTRTRTTTTVPSSSTGIASTPSKFRGRSSSRSGGRGSSSTSHRRR